MTVTAPALPAGVTAVIVVLFTTTTLVADALPKVTVAPETKFVPVMVTAVPPDVVPVLGLTLVTVGIATYVNPFARLPFCPLTVTVTETAPAVPAGVVAEIVVLFTTDILVAAADPNVTDAPVAKFVPVIVTAVPPTVEPLFGLTLVIVGAVLTVAENVAICITQAPAEFSDALALLLPATLTTLSSAISPSGEVIMREVNPVPAARVEVATVFAPKINSLATLVVMAPLLAVLLFPLAPAVTSSVPTPLYSRIRTSG